MDADAADRRETRQSSPRPRTRLVDVADAAGVSASTVSNALTGSRPVDEETRRRVEAAALALGYRPNLSARRLRSGGSGAIAIFSSMPFAISAGASRLGFMMEIAAAASLAAMQEGIALVLVPPLEKRLASIANLDIDGAIVIEPSQDDPYLSLLAERRLPVVSIGRVPGGVRCAEEVDLQSGPTASLLLRHLSGVSDRVALVIGNEERSSYAETEDVYRAFCAERRQEAAIVRVREAAGETGAYEAVRALLEEDPQIDGLLVLVDTFATGAVRAAHAMGRRIPEDLVVATRYNGPRAMECEPPLTAVDLHLGDVAAQAVSMLLSRIGVTAAAPDVSTPTLIPRRSTARFA